MATNANGSNDVHNTNLADSGSGAVSEWPAPGSTSQARHFWQARLESYDTSYPRRLPPPDPGLRHYDSSVLNYMQRRPWVCPQVGCTSPGYSRRADLERHFQRMHLALPGLFDCPVPDCNRKGPHGLPRRDKLREHIRERHNMDISNTVGIQPNLADMAAHNLVSDLFISDGRQLGHSNSFASARSLELGTQDRPCLLYGKLHTFASDQSPQGSPWPATERQESIRYPNQLGTNTLLTPHVITNTHQDSIDGEWSALGIKGLAAGSRQSHKAPSMEGAIAPTRMREVRALTPIHRTNTDDLMYTMPPASQEITGSSYISKPGGKVLSSQDAAEWSTDSGYQSRPREEMRKSHKLYRAISAGDTGSICSDGRSANLPQDVKESLATLFAERLVDHLELESLKLHAGTLENILPAMLRDFAVLLCARAISQVEEAALTFVRHQRARIARETNDIVHSKPNAAGVPDLLEKMRMWHNFKDATDADQSSVSISGADEVDDRLEDFPLPKDTKKAQTFLVEGQEFQWLLNQIKVVLPLQHGGLSTDATIRSQLVDCFACSSAAGPERSAVYNVHWCPGAFIRDQYQECVSLEQVVVLIGSASSIEATTCGDYVKRRWPGLGPSLVSWLDNAISRGAYTGPTWPPHYPGVSVVIELSQGKARLSCTGYVENLVEIGEILAWIGAACRASPLSNEIMYCTPRVTSHVSQAGTEVSIDYSCGATIERDDLTAALCWNGMFANPTVTEGYPIASREDNLPDGLEMPFDMMFTLAQAPRALDYAGSLVMKGAISMLVPTLCTASTVVWHFHVNFDCSRMMLDRADSHPRANIQLHPEEMSRLRHIVGWTPRAHILAGTDKVSYDVRYSDSEAARPALCALSGVTLSVGKIATAGATFARGKKESPSHFSGSPYEVQIEYAADLSVVMHDTKSNIAWLLDGASALLHLSRAWLSTKYARSAAGDPLGEFEHASALTGFDSARQALLSKKNRSIRLFPKESDEQTSDSGSTKSTTKTTWWRWEDLVSDQWSLLDQIDLHCRKQRNSPTAVDIRVPDSKRLEGFEFVDLVAGRSIEPRFVTLAGNEWIPMVMQIGAVPILASGLGDLIIPATSDSSELKACSRDSTIPAGHDLLVVPHPVLERLSRGRFQQGTFRIGDSDCWIKLACTEACSCRTNSKKGCGELVTQLLKAKQAGKAKQPYVAMPADIELGASVFGKMSRCLVKKSIKRTRDCLAPEEPASNLRRRTSDSGIDMGSSGISSSPGSASNYSLPLRSPAGETDSTRSPRL